jgi:hypothetical protein
MDLLPIACFVVLYLSWIGAPLLPAWATYKITPDQNLGLKGPLNALKINTTGAFSAYLIVLIVSHSFVVEHGIELISGIQRPGWEVHATVVALSSEGKEIPLTNYSAKLNVEFNPPIQTLAKGVIVINLPMNQDRWPVMTLSAAESDGNLIGGAEIDLTEFKGVEIDKLKRLVKFVKPIVLRKPCKSAIGLGISVDTTC